MAINMTQKFVFESDELLSVRKVLNVIIPICFPKISGKYISLHITDEPVGIYDDGSYYDRGPDIIKIQTPAFRERERESQYALLSPNGMYHGASFVNFKLSDVHESKEDAATAACKMNHKTQPTRMFVVQLADYASSCKKDDICCDSHAKMIDESIRILGNADYKKFIELCGDGYDEGFNKSDGHVGCGYRIQHKPNGAWNVLQLSLCHMYYGK